MLTRYAPFNYTDSGRKCTIDLHCSSYLFLFQCMSFYLSVCDECLYICLTSLSATVARRKSFSKCILSSDPSQPPTPSPSHRLQFPPRRARRGYTVRAGTWAAQCESVTPPCRCRAYCCCCVASASPSPTLWVMPSFGVRRFREQAAWLTMPGRKLFFWYTYIFL